MKRNSKRSIHPDKEWIQAKINKRAGGYIYNLDGSGFAYITFIYGESKLKIFCLNVHLYFRWLKRVLKKNKPWRVKGE